MGSLAAQAAVMEFVGTFALIFIGAGSILTDVHTKGAVGLVGIALAHGLTIAVMASATGITSGGQLNPAVTFGLLVGRKIAPPRAALFMVAQLAGATAAGFLLTKCFAQSFIDQAKLGTPMLGQVSPRAGVAIEAVLTFFLVFVVYGTGVDERFGFRIGGLAIGATVGLAILMGGPLTGASMNPARTFGPALAGGFWKDHWVYWAGPLLGGGVAGALWGYFLLPPKEEKPAA